MRAFTSKDRTPATKPASAPATPALPPPYQLAIEGTAFRITVLEDGIARDCDGDLALVPPTWFSVTLTTPTSKRYLYLVQEERDTGIIVLVLLFDRSAVSGDGNGLRLPPTGAWLRAIVEGT